MADGQQTGQQFDGQNPVPGYTLFHGKDGTNFYLKGENLPDTKIAQRVAALRGQSQPASQTPAQTGYLSGLESSLPKPENSLASDLLGPAYDVGKAIFQTAKNARQNYQAGAASAQEVTPKTGIPLLDRATQAESGAMSGMAGVLAPLVGVNPVSQRERALRGDTAGIFGENTLPVASAVLPVAAKEAIGAVAPKAADALDASAAKNYQDVLNPTKQTTKFQTQKMMPQLLEEKPIAMTRQGLADKAAANAEAAGQQVESAVSNLQGNIHTQPVIDGLQNLKQANQVNGVSLRPEVDSAIDSVSDQIKQMGPDISLQDAVKARRILDNAVAEAKGYQGAQLSDASMAAIRKEAANSIRTELSNASPDLAAVNAKFHFWNTLSDVLDQTLQRKTGQVNAFPKLESAVAAAGGLAKSGVRGGLAYGAAMRLLGATIRGAAWNTVSAATKASIADALASGQFAGVNKLLGQPGLAGAALGTAQQNEQPEQQQDSSVPEKTGAALLERHGAMGIRQFLNNPVAQDVLNTVAPNMTAFLLKRVGVSDKTTFRNRGRNA